MKLAEFTEIETARLNLRPVVMTDSAAMFEYSSDWENLRYVFAPHLSIEETQFAIAHHFMRQPLGKWGLELKDEHKLIGTLNFTKIDEKNARVELGYVLNRAYWGQGMMTEALSALTEFCFEVFGLKTLQILVDQENLTSVRTAQKAGFQFVKRFKATNQYSQKISEFEMYQLTKKEFDEKMMRES